MKENDFHYVYGPVLSPRLGRSLGIDLVPFKTCNYDCIYCQLGRTTHKTLERKECINGDEILREVERKISAAPPCDVVTLSGSGEPTLNNRIGDIITEIKKLTTVPVAVLTNGSLLWMEDVRESLMNADIVIPSLDAGDEHLFQHVNRPHRELLFRRVVEGLIHFTKTFPGSVWLEVFLLAGITGIQSEVEKNRNHSAPHQPCENSLEHCNTPTRGRVCLSRCRGKNAILQKCFSDTYFGPFRRRD